MFLVGHLKSEFDTTDLPKRFMQLEDFNTLLSIFSRTKSNSILYDHVNSGFSN